MLLQSTIKNLIKYIESRIILNQNDIDLIKKYLVSEEVSLQNNFFKSWKRRTIYLFSKYPNRKRLSKY